MNTIELTELDCAMIAAENGWDYLPACDEGFTAIDASYEVTALAVPVIAKINKRTLRVRLIRETMPLVKDEGDPQSLANDIYQDDEVFAAYPDEATREDIAWGIIRFCEHACGYRI